MIRLPDHNIIGIDPGPTESAWIALVNGRVEAFAKELNDDVLAKVKGFARDSVIVIETPQPYGVSVGQETFDTVFWAGRFFQVAHQQESGYAIRRGDVKRLLFGKVAGIKDADIWDYCIQQFGGTKEKAVGRKGTKKKPGTPGPLYGVTADCRQALGVALAWVVQQQEPGL